MLHVVTAMIVAEQGWIKVQEKTFTKWYTTRLHPPLKKYRSLLMVFFRLNAKVKPRNVAVQDLVADLSDGVHKPQPNKKHQLAYALL